MIFDRIFGLLAAAGFAFGVISQAELLSGVREPNLFEPPLAIFFVFAMSAFFYIYFHVGRRDGLPYDNGELAFTPMIFSLPSWAIAVSVVLLGYAVLLIVFAMFALNTGDILPDGSYVLREGETVLRKLSPIEYHLRANGIMISVVAMFTAFSFVEAAYLLIRPRTREFR